MKPVIAKRILFTAVVLICYFLQTTIFPHLAIARITPNILVAAVVSIGFLNGSFEGALAGTLSGFLLDISSGGILGIFMLVLTILGYLSGLVSEHLYDDAGYTPILIMAVSDLLYSLFVYVGYFLVRGRLNLVYYMAHVILPEIIYTCIVGWVLYNFLKTPSRRLNAM